jgi:GntR family transcriptional regulator, transcriptional repressor for pyruvate dehydrogenase complex
MMLPKASHIKERSRLAELVAERIGEWISARDIKPGDRMPSEPELVAHFGVSRGVIREALSKLQVLGVIEVFQGKGAFIAKLPIEMLFMRVRRLKPESGNLENIWELRETLETRIAELAAERRTRDDMRDLEDAMKNLGQPSEPGRLWDDAFHRTLAKTARNPVLEQMLLELVGVVGPTVGNSGIPRLTLASEIGAILEAVRAGDGAGARAAMLEHLQYRKKLLNAASV